MDFSFKSPPSYGFVNPIGVPLRRFALGLANLHRLPET